MHKNDEFFVKPKERIEYEDKWLEKLGLPSRENQLRYENGQDPLLLT